MKQKHSKPDEFLLEQVRALKKENTKLKKRLRQLEKNSHIVKELKLDLEADQEVMRDEVLHNTEPQLSICDSCFRRGLEEIKVINRVFKQCNICGWRSKAVISGE